MEHATEVIHDSVDCAALLYDQLLDRSDLSHSIQHAETIRCNYVHGLRYRINENRIYQYFHFEFSITSRRVATCACAPGPTPASRRSPLCPPLIIKVRPI